MRRLRSAIKADYVILAKSVYAGTTQYRLLAWQKKKKKKKLTTPALQLVSLPINLKICVPSSSFQNIRFGQSILTFWHKNITVHLLKLGKRSSA